MHLVASIGRKMLATGVWYTCGACAGAGVGCPRVWVDGVRSSGYARCRRQGALARRVHHSEDAARGRYVEE